MGRTLDADQYFQVTYAIGYCRGRRCASQAGVRVQSTEQCVADLGCDVEVIEAIRQTLYVLELVNLVEIEVRGTNKRLNFINEIDRLKGALRLMGMPEDEHLPWTLPRA